MNKLKQIILMLGICFSIVACGNQSKESNLNVDELLNVEAVIDQKDSEKQNGDIKQSEVIKQDENSEEGSNLIDDSLLKTDAKKDSIEESSVDVDSASDSSPDSYEYTLSETIFVSDERELTLKLHGKCFSKEDQEYGIYAIDVYEGEVQIQSILAQEAFEDVYKYFYEKGYTASRSEDGGFIKQDMNFDGAQDIGLVGWLESDINTPYCYWVWDEINNCFSYAFNLYNTQVDLENQQVIAYYIHGTNSERRYDYEYYQYDENGELVLTKLIENTYYDEGPDKIDTYNVVNGEYIKVESSNE